MYAVLLPLCLVSVPLPAQEPTPAQALVALGRACAFYHDQVGGTGPYTWRYSADLTLREGEGTCTPTLGWVQPPGLPTVGGAFLDAYEATNDRVYLAMAKEVADTLVRGQLHTGGWYYHVETDPTRRQEYLYRDLAQRKVERDKGTTTLDDNTTQAAVRFLMRIDEALDHDDAAIREAVGFCLDTLLVAQCPNGAWRQNWREYPKKPSAAEFPVLPASYPESWSRKWLNDWPGRYYLNDDVLMDMVDVMLAAYDTYGDGRCLESALHAGDFLILAQMPDPQPAWAQQYDPQMHPCWDRKFEPPAISGRESQDAMLCLIKLYRRSGDAKYLEPLPRAIEFLRASLLPDGRLARFYELQTNRPLYFTMDYQLTYDSADAPRHYRFVWESHLDEIQAEYDRARAGGSSPPAALSPELAVRVRTVIDGLDDRGAWVEDGVLDAHDLRPEGGIISSQTFADGVATLCAYLRAVK